MDPFVSSAILGVAGLGAMALGGVSMRSHHGGHGSHAGDGGHGGHVGDAGHGDAGHAFGHGHGHAHGDAGHAFGHGSHGHSPTHSHDASHGAHATAHAVHGVRDAVSSIAWTMASPRFLFSVALGLGVIGIITRPLLSGTPHVAVAVVGGVLFERFLVTPLWNLVMRFASTPASTLESSITDDATAVTAFDANGQGIVAIEVDGQVVQILATLRRDDRALGGARVRAGQRLRIEDVDAEKNRCTVSLL